jgi:hypothetical protein
MHSHANYQRIYDDIVRIGHRPGALPWPALAHACDRGSNGGAQAVDLKYFLVGAKLCIVARLPMGSLVLTAGDCRFLSAARGSRLRSGAMRARHRLGVMFASNVTPTGAGLFWRPMSCRYASANVNHTANPT